MNFFWFDLVLFKDFSYKRGVINKLAVSVKQRPENDVL